MTVLAEKLAARKDLVTRIGRLDDEIASALIYEEGETPEETENSRDAAAGEANELLTELRGKLDGLQLIENEIRAANMLNTVDFDGEKLTISEAIVLRDRIKTQHAAWTTIANVVDGVSPTGGRRSYGLGSYRERRKKDEINQRSAIAAKVFHDEADAMAKRLRLLDAEIQKVNWSTEV